MFSEKNELKATTITYNKGTHTSNRKHRFTEVDNNSSIKKKEEEKKKNSNNKNNKTYHRVKTEATAVRIHVCRSTPTALQYTHPGYLQDDGTVAHFSVKHHSQGSRWNRHLPKNEELIRL